MSGILALDIATKTGFAKLGNGEIVSGVYDMSENKGDMGKMGSFFSQWLYCQILDEPRVNHLIIERTVLPPKCNGDIVYRLSGLAFVAHQVAFDLSIPRFEVVPGVLKKFVTGNGRAKKKDMIAAVCEWGFNPQDDNEADALALLTYAQEELKL